MCTFSGEHDDRLEPGHLRGALHPVVQRQPGHGRDKLLKERLQRRSGPYLQLKFL